MEGERRGRESGGGSVGRMKGRANYGIRDGERDR